MQMLNGRDFENIVVLSDMDGTLLPSDKIPSEATVKAIKEFELCGGGFTVATGRALQAAKRYFNMIPLNRPPILCNGGLVLNIETGMPDYAVYLPQTARAYTEKILSDNKSLGCEVLTLDKVYLPQMNETEDNHFRLCQIEPEICALSEIPGDEWFKVLFADTPEAIDLLEPYVKAQDFTGVSFVRSADVYYEMLPQGSSKGEAARFFKKNYCGSGDMLICVGDYYNDMEMLSAADFAVCPSNAAEEVKDICDLVLESSCEQDALAELIYKLPEISAQLRR